MGAKLSKISNSYNNQELYEFYCPACGNSHFVQLKKNVGVACWDWKGDIEKPTFAPSLKVKFNINGIKKVCHFFFRNGIIEYLEDCTHSKAGKKVEMIDSNSV